MKLNLSLSLIKIITELKVLKMSIPFVVTWALTYRCNQKCLYCAAYKLQGQELKTPQILEMIDSFKKLGARYFSFTGGEPLLRDDIGVIIKYTKEKGIYVSMNSNASLVPDKITQLKGIDTIKFSLDGSLSVNDKIRGEGSFNNVMEAIQVCKKNNISVCIECVISKYNFNSLNDILEIASRLNLKVSFQPATRQLLYSLDINPLSPSPDEHKTAINYLMSRKREGAPIWNSLTALKHLYHWPNYKKINCGAGSFIFHVDPDGSIMKCRRAVNPLIKKGVVVKEAIKGLRTDAGCGFCWCGSMVEANLLSAFNIDAISNFRKYLR